MSDVWTRNNSSSIVPVRWRRKAWISGGTLDQNLIVRSISQTVKNLTSTAGFVRTASKIAGAIVIFNILCVARMRDWPVLLVY